MRNAAERVLPLGLLAALALSGAVLLSGCANVSVLSVSHAGDADGVSATSIRVGGMGSLSGFVAPSFAPVVTGAQVYFDALNAAGGVHGRTIDYSPLIDDGTSPSGDIAAAQRLVASKVFAVVGVGTPFFTGSSVLRSAGVPVFGLQENTNEQWAGPTMFGAGGSFVDATLPQPQVAYLLQQTHAHRAAVVAYNVAQSSGGCVSVIRALAQFHVPTPVIDLSIPFGAASLDADVTRLQQNHVDFVVSCMDATGNIKLSQTLQQHGMGSTVQYWFDGYNAQTLHDNRTAMAGIYYLAQMTPFEVSATDPRVYPGTDAFNRAMARYAPTTPVSSAALAGWVSADLFTKGLRAVGADVTRTRLVDAINRLTAYNADGAMPPVDWTIAHLKVDGSSCTAFVQVHGARFVPVLGTADSVYLCFNQKSRSGGTSSPASVEVPVTTISRLPGVPGR